MTAAFGIDGVLVQWGERLFYPRVRILKTPPPARLHATQRRASAIRARIEATVSRRAPQVMVKVTGGGRGMGAIAAHFRYISKNGRLDIEDERGVVDNGKDALHELVERWRCGGSLIDDVSPRREAFNIMLSMPQGTDPHIVLKAAREFAKIELENHAYAMVLHDHQANPHVHLAVRAESRFGARLNPRKADLHRWRETFAERLRGWGIDAEATRQATRGASGRAAPLWRLKAKEGGRLLHPDRVSPLGDRQRAGHAQAIEAWTNIARALGASDRPEDRKLSVEIDRFVGKSPAVRERAAEPPRDGRSPANVTPRRDPPKPNRDIVR